ncbi:MAG: ATP-binding protein [Paracoccaceae bacterium]
MWGWLKRLMPRGLYGRAALILLLPVVGLQLIVTVSFVQRYYEDVTRQMTRSVAPQIALVGRAEGARARALAEALEVDWVGPTPLPDGDGRGAFDLSGRVIVDQLHALLPQVAAVSLATDKRVSLWWDGDGAPVEIAFDRERVSAANPHQLLVVTVVLGAALTAVAYLYLRNQLRPVTRLAQAAQAYGRGRIVPYRPGGATEVRAAGLAFLDMRARLERQLAQRRQMLSGISHDLRTPLTRMRLALGMMDEEEAAPLLRDVAEMSALVDGFLDFARGGAGERREGIDLPALLAEVAQAAGPAVAVGTVARVTLPARPLALRRALGNLLGNALRYGTRARLSARVEGGDVTITVDDDGPGIPDAQRAEALRPFVRLDAARNQDRGGGVGLGLSIVRDVARDHGGRLTLSDAPDGGLRAELSLPLSPEVD